MSSPESPEVDLFTEAASEHPLMQVVLYGVPSARAIHETDFVRMPGEWPEEVWDDDEVLVIQVLSVSVSNHPGP